MVTPPQYERYVAKPKADSNPTTSASVTRVRRVRLREREKRSIENLRPTHSLRGAAELGSCVTLLEQRRAQAQRSAIEESQAGGAL